MTTNDIIVAICFGIWTGIVIGMVIDWIKNRR